MGIQKKHILECFEKSAYSTRIKSLHKYLLNKSKDGIVKNANYLLPEIINNLYADDEVSFQHDYLTLKNDNIISFDGTSIHMLLNNFDSFLCFNSLLPHFIPVRKSIKALSKMDLKRLEDSFIEEQKKAKLGSFKIPQSLIPYITGELLNSSSSTSLTQEQLEDENIKRSLPKFAKLYYLCCISSSNSNGVLRDFTVNYCCKFINSLFGYTVIPETNNCYRIHKMLIANNLIKEFLDPVTGEKCIEVVGYKEAFEKKDRYIVIPHKLVFNKEFLSMPAASMRMAFYFLSRLNNGENRNSNQASEKQINLKLFRYESDGVASLRQYYFIKSITKRRSNIEVFEVVKPLLLFFNFYSIKNGCFNVSVKPEFYISKNCNSKLKTFSRPSYRYPKKANIINNSLNKYSIEADDKSREEIILHLHRCSDKVIKKIIFTLHNDMEYRKYNSREKIKNISAYTLWLYRLYKEEQPVFLEKQITYIDFRKDFEDELQDELISIRYKKYDYNKVDIQAEIELYKSNYELSLEDIS